MIRSWAIMLLVLTGIAGAIPASSHTHQPLLSAPIVGRNPSFTDPNATTAAFNYTYSQANLYSANSTSTPPARTTVGNTTGAAFKWLNTVDRTSDNSPILGSGFRFNITNSGMKPGGMENVTWAMTIPQFNCGGCTGVSVNFNFFGRLTAGTNATYYVLNGTSIVPGGKGGFQSGVSLTCPERVCVNVTRYIGFTLQLTFSFGWNAAEAPGMYAEAGEIVVASIGNFLHSSRHTMVLDNLSGLIVHTANMTMISYNDTLTTNLHPGGNTFRRWWNTTVISIYYPAGYRIQTVKLNSTQVYPSSPKVPFEADNCAPNSGCSESLLALNMSDFPPVNVHNSVITIISTTPNSLSSLTPLSSGAPTQAFAPGDTISVKAVNSPAIVNSTAALQRGNLTLAFFDHTGTARVLTGQTFPTLTAIGGVYNLTLPSDCSGNNCGSWTIRANFTSHYDLGFLSTSFTIGRMQLSSFKASGSNIGLNVQGNLTYFDNSPAITSTSVIFAADSETPANIPIATSNYLFSGGGLYVANTSLVNGVFTQGQSLIMIFTIVNSVVYSNSSSPAFNATVTIDHEWPGSPPISHGVKANFTLGAGSFEDLTFTRGPQSYQAVFTITPNGLQLRIRSLSTLNFKDVQVGLGTGPVPFSEPHAGLFNITVVTKSHAATVSTSSILSAPYAYVFGLPLGPSKYLAYSRPVSGASFSTTLASDSILGAKKLVTFVLARDTAGVMLSSNGQNPGFSDSTTLQASMDAIGEVSTNQHVTATLHLTSNSTTLTQTFTINLNLQGSGVVANRTLTLTPGESQPVTLSFNAPPTTGQFTLSFSSPQYNGNIPLATQTLRVTILQSNLQILIPAAIGVVAAIIVLGVYLIKGRPETAAEEATKTKPTSPKPKPSGIRSSSKSLTQTRSLVW